jgi:hypothetical protein
MSVKRRLALNEARFREVNEGINRGHAAGRADEPVAFVCECSALGCNVLVELTLAEYEAVRADPHRFLLQRGHDTPEVERVMLEISERPRRRPGRSARASAGVRHRRPRPAVGVPFALPRP